VSRSVTGRLQENSPSEQVRFTAATTVERFQIQRDKIKSVKHNVPEDMLDETQIESDTLSAAFFIRGSNRREFTVPRLAAPIPTGHLKENDTYCVLFCQLKTDLKIGAYTNLNSPARQSLGWSPYSGQS